jgi:hypothetical protein
MSGSQDTDVLAAVPNLPSSEQSAKAAAASASQSSRSYKPPRIHLFIPEDEVPAGILEGVREIARNAPRKNIILGIEDGAYRLPRDKDAGDSQEWWWNVV